MKWIKRVMVSLLAVVFIWLILTVYAQLAGKSKQYLAENQNAIHKAIVVFNPDPFFNLDEQVCVAFAEGLRSEGFSVDVASYDLIDTSLTRYDLVVLCANTYNWSPDWRISNFIRKHSELKGKNCVAITLGSGSTERSKMLHEENIKAQGGLLLGSTSYWLLRPNDESRMKEANVEVAKDMAKNFGQEIAKIVITEN